MGMFVFYREKEKLSHCKTRPFVKSKPPAHLKPTKGADRKRASGAEVYRARTTSAETTAAAEADR